MADQGPPNVDARAGGGLQTFRALRHRDFRLLWVGLVVSAVGTWMQIIAQSLLVLQITHGSAFALGTVSLAQALSFFLFALIGGTIADRFDKRRLLLLTQTLSMVLAVLLGVLTVAHIVTVWMIVVLAFCSGTVLSFDQPTRGALVPMLVPPEDLMNAVSLQSVVFSGASTVGPALAGFAIAWVGLAGNFFLNAASYLGVLVALYFLRVPALAAEQGSDQRRGSLAASIRAALQAVARDPVLPWVISGYGALLFFGPSPALILPIYAIHLLHLNAVQLGFLFSATGLGTIIGALLIASLGDFRHKGALLLGSMVLWTLALALFAVSHLLWLSLTALLIFGVAQNGVGATAVTLLQTRVPPNMRGRVMSLNTLLIMGVRPLGDFPAGALIGIIGAPGTVLLGASLVGAYTLYLLAARPAVRNV